MKLTDLDPRWYVADEGGPRVGFTFRCPCCNGATRLAVSVHADGQFPPEDASFAPNGVWALHGEPNFETMTVTPSVDASAAGHWHGFITSGEIR